MDLPNLEGVQVLKGPQGTLYGRNATGGAILLSTVTPKDHWEGKAANGSSATGTYTPIAEPRSYGATIGAKF